MPKSRPKTIHLLLDGGSLSALQAIAKVLKARGLRGSLSDAARYAAVRTLRSIEMSV